MRQKTLALYIRLSKEDDDVGISAEKEESNSITNQRMLLYDYLKSHPEFQDYRIIEKCDDGYSGKKFDRPQFVELMELVRRREVDCILVKDFSRFGRDYIEIGDYLEQLFPFLGVRFIAVNDRYDSQEGGKQTAGLEVAFKNFIYDFYSRDTSKKIRNVRNKMAKAGLFASANAPYGYLKSAEDRHKLVIDEEAATVVREIFRLRLSGLSGNKIAAILNEREIPSPAQYALNHKRGMDWRRVNRKTAWEPTKVLAILRDERYAGNMVSLRRTLNGIYGADTPVEKEEWVRVENTHEPIIDKEVFYRVQEQIKSRRRQTKEKATPIFAGLVKCADCGWSMRFGTNKTNKTPYSYYACSYYGQFGKGNCSMHYIRYDVLYQAVLERLQYWAKAVQQDEEKVLNKIQKAGNAERIREKKKKASTLKKAENRQNEIDRLFAKMYEDRACEKITERNFVMLSSKYQKEQIELEQQITSLREELSKMEQDMIGAEKWIELIKEYSVPKELTAPLLNAMIEKILIHEATTNEDNERIQEIEIYYRFIGKVE